jgi:hypothetical protein
MPYPAILGPPPSRIIPHVRSPNMRVTLSRIPGLTDQAVLQRPFIFQTSPLEELRRSDAFTYNDWDGQSEQRDRPATRQLSSVSFRSLFIDTAERWTLFPDGGYMDPPDAVSELRAIEDSGTPFRLVIGQPALWRTPWLVFAATLRSLDESELAGEVDSRYVDVTFVQHRQSVITTRKATKGASGQSPHLPANLAISDLPASRDSLFELARFYYGEPSSGAAVIAASNPWLANWPRERSLKELSKTTLRSHPKVYLPPVPTPR